MATGGEACAIGAELNLLNDAIAAPFEHAESFANVEPPKPQCAVQATAC